MKGAELQPEQPAGAPTDPGPEKSAAKDVQWKMDADIDLGIGDQEGPGKYQPPPAAGRPEGEEQEEGQGKMGTGVRRGKTRAGGAIIGQETHIVCQQGILTGPEPEDEVFHQVAADQVADYGGHDQGNGPPPAFQAEIQGNKDQEEKVKRHP